METKDDDELALLIATLPSSLLIGVAFIEGHSKVWATISIPIVEVQKFRKKVGQRRMDAAFAVLTLPGPRGKLLNGGRPSVAPLDFDLVRSAHLNTIFWI